MRSDLKAEFKRRRLTQREVARRMGVTEGYVSFLLDEKRVMKRRMARAMSWATSIPLADILRDGDA